MMKKAYVAPVLRWADVELEAGVMSWGYVGITDDFYEEEEW